VKQLDDVRAKNAPLRGLSPALLTSVVLAATAASIFSVPVNADEKDLNTADDAKPIVLKTQGSFMAGGTVLTNPGMFDPIALAPDGQTIHGDHAYVQYQIPVAARKYPIVMWHGGGQFTKTWETTPARRLCDLSARPTPSRTRRTRDRQRSGGSGAGPRTNRRTRHFHPVPRGHLARVFRKRAVSARRGCARPVVAAADA
jgi:hypothetical protein